MMHDPGFMIQDAGCMMHDARLTVHEVCVNRVSCLEYFVHTEPGRSACTEYKRSTDFLKPYFLGW
jgi:hypothetical protein